MSFLLISALLNKLLDIIGESHFDEHGALRSILTMAIAYSEEVLMESLAHVRSQNEVVLVLFVGVMHAETFSCRVSKPCNYIVLYDFRTFIVLVLLYPERSVWGVLDSVVIVYPLV